MNRRIGWLALTLAALAACGGGGGSSPEPAPPEPEPPPPGVSGLDARPANRTCVALDRAGSTLAIAIEPVLTSLPAFEEPVALRQAPGDDARWFVLERSGRVRVFANNEAASSTPVFIDITSRVDSGPQEAGLLGIAFHPEFSTNGQVFLSYTRPGAPLVSFVSRFTSFDGGQTLDPASEEVILTLEQPFPNHNGGNIDFGPDGFLYIGFGDGGSGGDPLGNGQDTSNWFGALLRIDVDGAAPYAIPADNPFAASAGCGAGGCPEIYAWGFRNPWRWSFDSGTGELWLGDVGQAQWEEVDRIELGGNYGWNVREGAHCFNASTCDTTGLIDPVAEYPHAGGVSITGGYVYRGPDIPALAGSFIYGDFGSGTIWGLVDDGNGLAPRELAKTNLGISAFGQDAAGEIYVVDFFGGGIHRLVPAATPPVEPVADQLSATGCVAAVDASQPAAGLIPYVIRAPFHSDGADKQRWLAIPDGTTIAIDGEGDFVFPAGSVLMKHFSLGERLIETRLFMRHPDGVWAGYSYEWADDMSDATLVDGGKTRVFGNQTWIYPSGAQCLECHTAAAGFSLGLEVAQLNQDFTYPSTGRTANQLATLDAVALFDSPLAGEPDDLPQLADPFDASMPLDDRARAYLHTNCAQCHRPGGPAPTALDLRHDTSLRDSNGCDAVPANGDLGIADARIIAPGAPERSVLLERMRRRDAAGMPPLATNLVDEPGIALLDEWIAMLEGCG
ncbi:MAG: PQQ-dependent sugar dehydrogenase [Gammaproteobacteria bacterium]|nr:PQQ-dependent sugar dehydrogenase [Gammaproteobacteria bacterium]